MNVRFDHLTRAELDRELSPSLAAKDAAGTLSRHAEMSRVALAESGLEVLQNQPYGALPAERFDLIRPQGNESFPCLIFIHGGFWQEGSRAGSGFAAKALATQGWATALVGYTLAPEARLSEILQEIAQMVKYLSTHAAELNIDPDSIVLSGHSAGAHLGAAILAGKGGSEAADAVSGAILISGVYDLVPIAASYVNDVVAMDSDEVGALSLLKTRPLRDVPIHVLVGADETQSFLDQTEALYAAWKNHCTRLSLHCASGRNHFDILDTLAEPGSPTFAALQEMQL